MNLQKRAYPPRLHNASNCCSANCIFQVLLNDDDCWNMISHLNDQDPLKQIAIRFTTITRGNRSIDLGDLYDSFPPIIEVKNEEIAMHPNESIEKLQMDPLHIFEKILNRYQFLKDYFRNSDDTINYTQAISIEDDTKDVQNGLDIRINQTPEEFKFAPKCLCITVSRIILETVDLSCKENSRFCLSKKSINPNKFIHYSPLGTEIDEYYILYAMIYHRNTNYDQGHFEVLLFINDDFYQCNDSHITQYLKNEISDLTLKKKNYIFFYKKCDEKPSDYDDQIIITPPRKTIDIEDQFFINESDPPVSSSRINSSENAVFPVTALNSKTIPLFIPYTSQAEGRIIQPEIIIDEAALRSYRLVDKIESNAIKFDIHKNFKYLNGFLDIAPGEPPMHEYSTSNQNYEYTQKILEVFTEIITNLVFKSDSISNGEINANLTASELNIDFDSPLELQVKEVGEILYNLFKDYDNKKPKINKKKIEEDIVDLIQDLIYYDIDEEGNLIPEHKRDHLHEPDQPKYPDENYKWELRINEYGIDKILKKMENINIEQKEKSSSLEKKDKVREKLWNDFLSKKSYIKNRAKFIKEWVKSRDAAVTEGAEFISEKRAYTILNDYIKKGDIILSKKHTGAPPKFSNEARLCLLATVMDFPTLTDEQRTGFLNKYGPCKKKNVSVRLVNKELARLNITIKKPCFSEPQRNSIGFRIARYIWSKIMLVITDQRNSLFVFIDEAGVQRSQPNSSRGFVSVQPLTEGTTKSNNVASILAAIIPGYGSITRWYKGSVTNNEYSQFLREISYILRNLVCNQSTQIITIQDNASIHKTIEVREMAKKCNINLFFTVPYSPHLNEVAENYFGQLKFACIFDPEFACRDECDGINGTTRYQFLNEEEIMYRWNEMTRQKYSGISALSIYQGWISILHECAEGRPLTGKKFSRSEDPNFHLNNIQCYRKNLFSYQ